MSVQMDENLGSRRGDDLLDALARQLGGRFTAKTVFGEPVERGAVTVIPVAALRFGFGGGSGSDPEKRQQGEGGGAGGISRPVGHIEIRGDGSRFVPVVDPVRVVAVVAAATCAALLIARRR
jgi:uncharacterized spore protein YtfJ